MQFNWKLVSIISCVALIISLAAVIIGHQLIPQETITISLSASKTQSAIEDSALTLPTASITGDIDDAVNAILQSALFEEALIADEDNDTFYYDYDFQAASDFGQANDESQF